MGIDSGSPFMEQIFWVDGKHCLRPMLAPNLYVEMRELLRITRKPVKIFEMGSCFRKESQGAQHLNEFTMLNLVELASVKDGEQLQELERLATSAMEALGLKPGEYEFVQEDSEVYGKVSFDILINGMEVASGSYGPHFLDPAWGVFDTWVGIGFGIERLTMALDKGRTIKRYGRTLSFIDGEPLNI
jgi:phenylalanyl-tRNA synthetase alpha chain